MKKSKNGFREIEHTADLELEVWGQDLPSLFQQAALGLYHLSQIEPAENQPRLPSQSLQLNGIDWEDLLVAFLDELLYLLDEKKRAVDFHDLNLDANYTLESQGETVEVSPQFRSIKAVTYHNLKIRETENGYTTNIVLDV
ncbi:MAG: putative protein archease [Chloroflexi bacterium]|nr:putative protein archease [Chloroflexota bacterium]